MKEMQDTNVSGRTNTVSDNNNTIQHPFLNKNKHLYTKTNIMHSNYHCEVTINITHTSNRLTNEELYIP